MAEEEIPFFFFIVIALEMEKTPEIIAPFQTKNENLISRSGLVWFAKLV